MPTKGGGLPTEEEKAKAESSLQRLKDANKDMEDFIEKSSEDGATKAKKRREDIGFVLFLIAAGIFAVYYGEIKEWFRGLVL